MQGLNYHHLLYFWLAAKKGGVTAAARQLNLAQPTISGQIRQLETALGAQLFTRAGRGLQLTEVGRTVYSYADEIFSLGEELVDTLQGELARPQKVVVGVSRGVPRLIVSRLLSPGLHDTDGVRFAIRNLDDEGLARELKVHGIDAALTDTPPDAKDHGRAFAHMLGESPVALYADSSLAGRYPGQLSDQVAAMPLVLPAQGTGLRASLDDWFEGLGITPKIAAEVEDVDLMPMLAREGAAGFFAAEALEEDLRALFKLSKLGRLDKAMTRYWAIAVDRRFRHGSLHAMSEAAREYLKPPAAAAQ